MPLRESKGDMYPFVTDTWNAIKGKCYHDCSYCYMKRFPLNPARLDRKEFRTKLGENRFIFVGSSCDMWSKEIPDGWILPILRHCRESNPRTKPWDNSPAAKNHRYLFQSKNPVRFMDFIRNIDIDIHNSALIPKHSIFATTIESNLDHDIGAAPNCPTIDARRHGICLVRDMGFPTTVTIEPIMAFDINDLIAIITDIDPEWVTIGADSKGHDLPEPDKEDVGMLIKMLRRNYEVVIKKNLGRLLP